MNLKDYIQSGIIESYVMGLASESERAEFEQLCTQHPELVAARRKFEEGLEEYASQQAVPPPPEVKVKVLEAIGDLSSRPQTSVNPSSKIITMENSKGAPRSSGLPRLVAAAAVILLAIVGWMYFQSKQQIKDLADENDRLRASNSETKSTIDKILQEQKQAIGDPNTTVVNMVGTKVAPKSSANVYWDSASTSVYLVVKNMPKLPSDQQYQLWALIDGKPKDLGVFDGADSGSTNKNVIIKMKNTQKAQAFAITIEKQGGAPSPTLEKMQSLGKTQATQ
ncbi:MAG: anti-sigma factor [Bacteroidetes bacterium]|nr:anti-sigma factor [Bacteroidota bacterium]